VNAFANRNEFWSSLNWLNSGQEHAHYLTKLGDTLVKMGIIEKFEAHFDYNEQRHYLDLEDCEGEIVCVVVNTILNVQKNNMRSLYEVYYAEK